jgi:hypothetical protein
MTLSNSAQYAWTMTDSLIPVPAQVAGERLEKIRQDNGGKLEPEMVVDDSRPQEAPLHKAFEWDDAKAGELYRVDQAKQIIRHVVIQNVTEEGTAPTKPVRAFVSVQRDGERSYTSMAHAMSDADLRKQVLERAMSELQNWRSRYKDLQELAQVYAAIDQTQETIKAA